jgi:hypothetical protein
MHLDRQRAKDAIQAAVGVFVGMGFVSWLLNDPFSTADVSRYAAFIAVAAIFGYMGWPQWIRRKSN